MYFWRERYAIVQKQYEGYSLTQMPSCVFAVVGTAEPLFLLLLSCWLAVTSHIHSWRTQSMLILCKTQRHTHALLLPPESPLKLKQQWWNKHRRTWKDESNKKKYETWKVAGELVTRKRRLWQREKPRTDEWVPQSPPKAQASLASLQMMSISGAGGASKGRTHGKSLGDSPLLKLILWMLATRLLSPRQEIERSYFCENKQPKR